MQERVLKVTEPSWHSDAGSGEMLPNYFRFLGFRFYYILEHGTFS